MLRISDVQLDLGQLKYRAGPIEHAAGCEPQLSTSLSKIDTYLDGLISEWETGLEKLRAQSGGLSLKAPGDVQLSKLDRFLDKPDRGFEEGAHDPYMKVIVAVTTALLTPPTVRL